MFWALILIASCIALIKFQRLRKAVLVVAASLALCVSGYLVYDQHETSLSKTRVRPDQLTFTEMRLGPGSFGSSYRLVGRVKNNSPFTVFDIKARVQIRDCDVVAHCETVGEEEKVLEPVIPPDQVRDIEESLYFGQGTHVKGSFQWNYTITEARAR